MAEVTDVRDRQVVTITVRTTDLVILCFLAAAAVPRLAANHGQGVMDVLDRVGAEYLPTLGLAHGEAVLEMLELIASGAVQDMSELEATRVFGGAATPPHGRAPGHGQ